MNGNHIIKIGITLLRSFWELIVSVNLASGSRVKENWRAAEGSVVSGSVEDAIMGFKKNL